MGLNLSLCLTVLSHVGSEDAYLISAFVFASQWTSFFFITDFVVKDCTFTILFFLHIAIVKICFIAWETTLHHILSLQIHEIFTTVRP